MNKYILKTSGRCVNLMRFAESAAEARREAEDCGHRIESVQLVRTGPPVAIRPVCRCGEEGVTCPAHWRLQQ